MSSLHLPADAVRTLFSRAMSAMYRREVPQYGTLLDLVAQANEAVLAQDATLARQMRAEGELNRLNEERHGAIRLGTAAELRTVGRLFGVMGMVPVGYYDLSAAGVPVHSTAFRPVADTALRTNPFRVFTSLLRLDLLEDEALRHEAEAILARRRIFTPGLLALLDRHDVEGGFGADDAAGFVAEALETFRWHGTATVDEATYRAMQRAHRLVADVVCFRGPHINHLTPRTLDIDRVQAAMLQHGIDAKATIEGPPRRACPILLRQTSFKALEEPIQFGNGRGGTVEGSHTARFGEIEQRGVALTVKGRTLYDRLLAEDDATSRSLPDVFAAFPDDHRAMHRDGLAFYSYRPGQEAAVQAGDSLDLDALVRSGTLEITPITYEDFLPVSAAGIFQSNLGDADRTRYETSGQRGRFEAELDRDLLNESDLYEAASKRSLKDSFARLGLGD